jgi:membrane protease YdiL (CAAX protease family)
MSEGVTTPSRSSASDIIEPAGPAEYVNVLFLCTAAVLIIGMHRLREFLFGSDMVTWIGWGVLAAGALLLLKTKPDFKRHTLLVYVAIALLGITPITTDVSIGHMLEMGTTLSLAVAIPYLSARFLIKSRAITFQFHHGRRWTRLETFYVFLAILIAYLLLPFYLVHTGAYQNWVIEADRYQILRVFIGTNGLGIWDELFFVNICLGIFRRYFSFAFANIAQSILFTAFLFELGFTGWGPIMIYLFALIQGVTFRNTESLLYVIVIHLSIDLVLFLALVNAHLPEYAAIFITG